MSNLNPLSVHKILGHVLGYEDLKNPTKEMIRENIAKKKKAYILPFLYRITLMTIVSGLAFNTGMNWYFYGTIILLFLGVFVSMKHKSDLAKKYDISDEEIEEQLEIYRKWSG